MPSVISGISETSDELFGQRIARRRRQDAASVVVRAEGDLWQQRKVAETTDGQRPAGDGILVNPSVDDDSPAPRAAHQSPLAFGQVASDRAVMKVVEHGESLRVAVRQR